MLQCDAESTVCALREELGAPLDEVILLSQASECWTTRSGWERSEPDAGARAGANVHATSSQGHAPLDLAKAPLFPHEGHSVVVAWLQQGAPHCNTSLPHNALYTF
mmetsp:Transcript_54728/g.119141  ORF Transcript_54728/g.119141 Transcript_54728/m.119141 type:complete len:106 (+) Transcript_54728:1-318(+)